MDKQAGIYLEKKVDDAVQKGEILYTIYAEFSSDFKFAIASSEKNNAYLIGNN